LLVTSTCSFRSDHLACECVMRTVCQSYLSFFSSSYKLDNQLLKNKGHFAFFLSYLFSSARLSKLQCIFKKPNKSNDSIFFAFLVNIKCYYYIDYLTAQNAIISISCLHLYLNYSAKNNVACKRKSVKIIIWSLSLKALLKYFQPFFF